VSLVRRHRPLVALVLVAAAARTLLAWRQGTPILLPDEYIYSELARSLGAHGLPEIRGQLYAFPALLASLLTAPAWLVHDVGIAYRLAQAEGAFAVSLAAVPAYGLARRLGVESRLALLVAATTVLVPDAAGAGLLTSEPFAYPLFLAALWALVVSLSGGGRRSRVAFLCLTGLACLARVQLLVLPLAYAFTLLATSGRRRELRRTIRSHALPAGTFLAAAVAAAAAGPARAAGVYGALFDAGIGPGDLAHWMAVDAVIVFVAAGWLLVPGAALGLGSAVWRPASRAEEAFGWAGGALTLMLLVEAAFFGHYTAQLVERYAFYAAPIVVLAFALAHGRGLLRTRAHVIGCAALAVLGVLSPLVDDVFFSSADQSAVLLAYAPLHRALDWRAPIVAGPVLAALAVAALVLGARGRALAACSLATGVCLTVTAAATQELRSHARTAGDGGGSFVDRAGVRTAPLLAFPATSRGEELTTLFWNRSIDRVLRLGPGTDGFASAPVQVGARGVLLRGQKKLEGPLVVDRTGALARFGSGTLVARTKTAELWTGRLRLDLLVEGYYSRGRWLGNKGAIQSWAPSRLSLTVHSDVHRTQRLVFSSGSERIAVIVGAKPRTVVLPLAGRRWAWLSHGTWKLTDGRLVALHVDRIHAVPA
jgi:hypothetical protein